MAAQKQPAATIFKWLRDNGQYLGAITGQDDVALKAAVQVAALWCVADSHGRSCAADAFGACVEAMQPGTRYLAYHAIAHVADWHNRGELWREAHLEFPEGKFPECKFAPTEVKHQ
jgi:hypothetical protein